jgi:HK97 family phage major capsid protein
MTLKKCIGLCYLTDELLEDTVALEKIVKDAFKSEIIFQVEDNIINGTGAGRPLGIMNAPCLVSVAKESGQAATTVVYENLTNMWSRLHPSAQKNAVWLIHPNCYPQLLEMSLSVGTGGSSIFVQDATKPGSMTIFGRPIIASEFCQTLGTTGDIILGDFSQYLLLTKGGLQTDSSIHVRFIYDETTLRFVFRIDGQPAWHNTLTPYKGTDTQSPFVALATRS